MDRKGEQMLTDSCSHSGFCPHLELVTDEESSKLIFYKLFEYNGLIFNSAFRWSSAKTTKRPKFAFWGGVMLYNLDNRQLGLWSPTYKSSLLQCFRFLELNALFELTNSLLSKCICFESYHVSNTCKTNSNYLQVIFLTIQTLVTGTAIPISTALCQCWWKVWLHPFWGKDNLASLYFLKLITISWMLPS